MLNPRKARNNLSLHFSPSKIDIQNGRQTWPLCAFDREKGQNVKCNCIFLFSWKIPTFYVSIDQGEQPWPLTNFSSTGGRYPYRILKVIKLKVKMKVVRFYRPILYVKLKGRACQDEIPYKFHFDNCDFFQGQFQGQRPTGTPNWPNFYFIFGLNFNIYNEYKMPNPTLY